jgi:Uma2 family endonuclease
MGLRFLENPSPAFHSMSSVDRLVEPLRHSPQLPQAMAILLAEMDSERKRREQFYSDMTPEQKIEFIDGEVLLHSPARNRHLDVTANVFQLVRTYVSRHELGQVKSEKCLCVFPRNDYEPDIVYFGPDKSSGLTAETMKFPVPDLAVEVLSPSTEARDRGVKFEDFASNGVAEYWLIDADAQFVEQYVLESDQYQLVMKSGSGVLKCQAIAGLKLPIESFFDEKANLQTIRQLLGASQVSHTT